MSRTGRRLRLIDRFWARLTEGGKEVQCGWLVDRFGVSWQIVPRVLPDLIGSKDPVKAGRAMQAMLQMKRLDISALQRAHDGGARYGAKKEAVVSIRRGPARCTRGQAGSILRKETRWRSFR